MPISTASAICRVHNHVQRRHLFSLPNFPTFTPSLPGGQTYHERRTVPSVLFRFCPHGFYVCLSMTSYTRRQLYAVVSDVDSYASFVPFCTRSRIIRPLAPTPTPATPNAQQMEAELTVAFLAFTERYTSRVTCVPYESVKVRIPFSIFGKIIFVFRVFRVVSIPILIGVLFLVGSSVSAMGRLSRNRLRHCSRASRRRGVFILLQQRTRTTIILLDSSLWRRKMSARHSFRSPSHSRLRIRFTLRFLVPFLGGFPG